MVGRFLWELALMLAFTACQIGLSFNRWWCPTRKNVAGETVLITGAGSGIGRLIAVRFAQRGANVVLWDIDKRGNEETAAMCKKTGVQVFPYTVDVSKSANVYAAATRVQSDVGRVTILINNAGIVTGKSLLECSDEEMQRTMDINATSHFWTTKAFLPSMIEKNHGHVVSIASSAGLVGVTGLADYCSSKHAAVGFNESVRMELTKIGATKVYTTTVCPYFINTGMFDGVRTKYPFILPILEPEYAADSIVDAILRNQAFLALPGFIYLIPVLRLLPVVVQDRIAHWLGVSNSMDQFIGRKNHGHHSGEKGGNHTSTTAGSSTTHHRQATTTTATTKETEKDQHHDAPTKASSSSSTSSSGNGSDHGHTQDGKKGKM